jgi:hypothetical protein
MYFQFLPSANHSEFDLCLVLQVLGVSRNASKVSFYWTHSAFVRCFICLASLVHAADGLSVPQFVLPQMISVLSIFHSVPMQVFHDVPLGDAHVSRRGANF